MIYSRQKGFLNGRITKKKRKNDLVSEKEKKL